MRQCKPSRGRAATGLVLLLLSVRASADDVKLLLQDLHRNDLRRSIAAARLVALGPAVFPRVIKEYRKKDDVEIRRDFAALLAEFPSEPGSLASHAGDLARLMRDPDTEVRAIVGRLLRKVETKGVPTLARLLGSRHADVRDAAADALGEIGPAAFEAMRKLLAGDKLRGRLAALLAIARTGQRGREFLPDVLPLLRHDEAALRRRAAYTLGWLGNASDKAVFDRLLASTADPDATVAFAAARALGRVGIDRLEQVVDAHKRANGRRRAMLRVALRNLPTTGAAKWETALHASADPAPLLAAMSPWFPHELSPATRAKIASWATDRALPLRRAALTALASDSWPDRPRTRAIFAAGIDDTDAACRASVFRGLGLCGVGDLAPKLVAALKGPDRRVRMEAAYALWRHGDPRGDPLPVCMELAEENVDALERIMAMDGYAWPASRVLAHAARSEDPRIAVAAAKALAFLLTAGRSEHMHERARAFAALPGNVREAASGALRWLAGAQEPDGRWSAARWRGPAGADVGVTGLAVLAFLSAGNTDVHGKYAPAVSRGLRFLRSQQGKDGHIGRATSRSGAVQHAIATTALCEAGCFDRGIELRAPELYALYWISAARNPYKAWRYGVRSGENDTYITAWMLRAIRTAEISGLPTSIPDVLGAKTWVEQMTDPNFGAVGYNYPGGGPARPVALGSQKTSSGILPAFQERDALTSSSRHSRATIGAGVWCRLLLGSELKAQMIVKGFARMDEKPPRWDTEKLTIDLCYWHWGALAMAQRKPGPWRAALVDTLFRYQIADGSWAPVGVWGRTGGRVFATASAVLALLAPSAHPQGCFDESGYRKRHAVAFREYRKALKSDQVAVRHAAQSHTRRRSR